MLYLQPLSENRYQKKLDFFPKTVAGFKQMFLYLQPLLKRSSFTD